MKVLFILDGLRSGGKERRALSLLKKLSLSDDFKVELILLNKDIHFEEVFELKFDTTVIDRQLYSHYGILKKIRSIRKEFQPNIIHAWDTLSTLYAIPSSLFSNSKLLTSKITDAPPNYRKLSYYGVLSEVCFFFSDFILANSYAGLNVYGVSSRKSKVIYNGFDFNRIKNIAPVVFTEHNLKNKFIVSMIASFSLKKDFNTYLKAANEVTNKRDDIVFLCIGDGPNMKPLQECYQNKSIIFLGKRDDVDSIVCRTDLGVLLSTDGEGISNSLLELMAQGKPVIASNFNGNKELIVDKQSGFILSSNDYMELAELIVDLVENKSLISIIGSNASIRVKNVFEINRMIKDFKIVYKEILN